MHKSSFALAFVFPLAFIAPPSMALPFDLALAALLTGHTHIGMNFIFTDYVPGSPTGAARKALLASKFLS